MQVIGVGVGRTGTLSLRAGLEQLGFGPCFHGRHVLDHPDRLALWESAANGATVDWDKLFDGYLASVDWPGAAFWRQLVDYFPDAKFILTTRDPERWYDSVRGTIYQLFGGGTENELAEVARQNIPGITTMHRFHRTLIWDGFFDGRFEDRENALRAFEEHNASVRRELPADRLLDFEPGDGWGPLCQFLEVDVPDEQYPHLNDPNAFWGRVQARLDESAVHPRTD